MPKSIFIEGRSWFDKINGNTYWSTRVHVDGAVAFQLPMMYGYGDQYLYDSLKRLTHLGFINFTDFAALRADGVVLYHSNTLGKKSAMFREFSPTK